MATIISDRRYTPNDLLILPDGEHFELVDGQLSEKSIGALECRVAMLLGAALTAYVEANKLGSTFSELGFQCFSFAPGLVLRPDISFITSQRLSHDFLDSGLAAIAPDLAVEIISPTEVDHDVDRKIDEYLRAGVRVVWIVNPRRGSVLIHRADGTTAFVGSTGELGGENVVPGFCIPVAKVLTLPGRETDCAS
jgi:Uma2 family endonuclease